MEWKSRINVASIEYLGPGLVITNSLRNITFCIKRYIVVIRDLLFIIKRGRVK